jgi:uroporphyrin-3 C-methyltransferase
MENLPESKSTTVVKTSRLATFLAVLGILGVVLLALALIYLWLTTLTLERRVFHLRSHVQQHQQILTNVQSAIQTLSQPQEKRTRALTEADYLVRLADLSLDFENNIPLTINLLKMADEQLGALNDPTLTRVRQTLTEDITTLQAVPKVDLSGLILKINAISDQIPQLPIIPTELSKPAAETALTSPQTTQPTSVWVRGLDAVGRAFKNVVVVRHLEQPVEPLLPPQQRAYLVLNIQSKLSQAEWAVLHQQPEIYQQSLRQVIAWVQQYFTQNATITQSVLQELTELQKANVKPVKPTISNSLNAIQNALNLPAPKPAIPNASTL